MQSSRPQQVWIPAVASYRNADGFSCKLSDLARLSTTASSYVTPPHLSSSFPGAGLCWACSCCAIVDISTVSCSGYNTAAYSWRCNLSGGPIVCYCPRRRSFPAYSVRLEWLLLWICCQLAFVLVLVCVGYHSTQVIVACFRTPYVTGSSVLAVTFSEGVLLASDTLGAESSKRSLPQYSVHLRQGFAPLSWLRWDRLVWIHETIQVLRALEAGQQPDGIGGQWRAVRLPIHSQPTGRADNGRLLHR